MDNTDMYQNFNVEGSAELKFTKDDNNEFVMNDCATPIVECPQEKCVHRQIIHNVEHVVPCNTRIINHHIFRHRYIPQYTCCEENEYSNEYIRNC